MDTKVPFLLLCSALGMGQCFMSKYEVGMPGLYYVFHFCVEKMEMVKVDIGLVQHLQLDSQFHL